jgi:TrmH family RNA methyltransferase
MISKSRLTLLRALRQKKNRADLGLFVAEGDKLVLELLNSDLKVKTIYATEKWLDDHSGISEKADEAVKINKEELSRISSLVTPQDVIVVAEIPHYKINYSKLLNEYCLVLDGIRDPGNLGAIIRIADWFGIRDIICSPDTADTWNPKVVQASMGSLIRVRLHEIAPDDFVHELKKIAEETGHATPSIFGTFLNGNNIYKTEFPSSGCIVIGNEANGIRPETEKLISKRITIPSWQSKGDHSGNPESLNAAIATAIVCAELRRSAADFTD